MVDTSRSIFRSFHNLDLLEYMLNFRISDEQISSTLAIVSTLTLNSIYSHVFCLLLLR
jgi:hypothetical protein